VLTRLELAIAWRYLRSRRGSRLLSLISVIAIAGVLVGVSALIVIMGVMNGLQRDLREKILLGSPDVRVLPYGSDLRLGDWRTVLAAARAVPGVRRAGPFVQTQALVRNLAGYRTGAQVVGLAAQGSPGGDVTAIRSRAILGDFRFVRDGVSLPGAVLGKLLAAKLNTFPGDTIVLLGEAGLVMNAATGVLVPRADSMVVSGVFETGMFEYDDAYLYLDLATAQRFAGVGDDVTGLEVAVGDRWQAPVVAARLQQALQGMAPVRAVDWQEQNRSLFQALKLEKLGMGVILLLIVLVAAFNIVSTLTMVVADKTREIGILRAMGMPARGIRRIFLVQGLVVGAVGTGGGVLLGLGVALLLERYQLIALDPSVYFIDHLPVAVQGGDVVLIVLASLVVAAVATLYPAAQAARLYPVEAIRHE
jgi:lipoprotein-releasing system permease protein